MESFYEERRKMAEEMAERAEKQDREKYICYDSNLRPYFKELCRQLIEPYFNLQEATLREERFLEAKSFILICFVGYVRLWGREVMTINRMIPYNREHWGAERALLMEISNVSKQLVSNEIVTKFNTLMEELENKTI